jgi:hypothetical protein
MQMKGIKYTKSIGSAAKRPNGCPLQCKQFDTKVTAPAKAHKPKLWGFHSPKNAKPSLCVVSDAQGKTLRIVKSIRVR